MGLHELFSLETQTLDDRAHELGHSILVLFLYDFLYIIIPLASLLSEIVIDSSLIASCVGILLQTDL